MRILIVGGVSSLLNQLIRKAKKEGHRVYLLTGSRYSPDTYDKVFERYDLSYDSDCLSDVFESVSPDVTLFMGAFDTNFSWTNEERELVRLTSGLTNLLTAHDVSGKGRFIFLSSEAVYSESRETDITENVPMSPLGLMGMALAQCEDICESFRKNRETDVISARIDHYYMIPKKQEDVNDACSEMCLEALRTGKITVNKNKRFSLLYESDAVEFIFKLVRCTEHRHQVYNLSSSREISELELAKYIQQYMNELEYGKEYRKEKEKEKEKNKKKSKTAAAENVIGAEGEGKDGDGDGNSEEEIGITIVEKPGPSDRQILDNKRFDREFGIKIFAETRETVEKVVKYMVAHKYVFLTGEQENKSLWQRIKEKAGWLFGAIFPYIENIVFFILIYLLNGSSIGSRYLTELDLYLLYVLTFAVVYGQHQATFSALLAVVGTYIFQAQERTFLSVALDYNTYIWIAQLFIVGLVVGYLKDQIRKLELESEEERKFLGHQLSDIKDINGSNVRIKDALETEIINQQDSVGKVYHITSKLEQYMPEEVLFYAAETMREILKSDDIAIYTVSNDTYARLFSFTSDKAKSLGKSIRYRELDEVYEALMSKKVYINRNMDNRYPMMANAIFDDDQIQTIIMVWGLPWERMTLGQADMLTVVTYLIQNAVLRATRQIAMLENQRYEGSVHVMKQEAFTPLVHAFISARNKSLTECAVLRVLFQDEKEKDGEGASGANTGAAAGAAPAAAAAAVRAESGSKENGKKQVVVSSLELNQRVSQMISEGIKRLSGKKEEEILEDKSPEETFVMSGRYAEAGEVLIKKIRQEDYIGVLEDGNLYILLSNSSDKDAAFVVDRIENEGYHCILLEDFSI